MQIRRIRPVLLSYDTSADPPLEWVGGRITTWDAALVEVTTADGAVGLGEVAQATMAAEAVPGIVAALERYLPAGDFAAITIGDHLRAQTRFWARGGISSGVIAAIEIACLDAEAREAGVPLWRHLARVGGGDPDAVAPGIDAYASGGLGTTPEQVTEWVQEQERAGFRIAKIRAMEDASTTIDLLEYLAPRLAPGTRICLDAVQGCASHPWSADAAIRVGKAFQAILPWRWYEEPCAAEDIAGYAAVTAALDVPVSGVESYSVREDFTHLFDVKGVRLAQPDLSMVGGFAQFKRVADEARGRGLECVPHVWGSGVQLLTSVHAALAVGLELVEVCTLLNPMREATQEQPLRLVDGRVTTASLAAAGSGAYLPDDAEERFAFLQGRGMLIK